MHSAYRERAWRKWPAAQLLLRPGLIEQLDDFGVVLIFCVLQGAGYLWTDIQEHGGGPRGRGRLRQTVQRGMACREDGLLAPSPGQGSLAER